MPCHDQDKAWKESIKTAYYYVMERADSVRYSSETYYNGCMHKRNRDMVDGSQLCVAYCGKKTGGSAYTVGYAEEKGLKVINLFEEKAKDRECFYTLCPLFYGIYSFNCI